jgi:hypothetical protein
MCAGLVLAGGMVSCPGVCTTQAQHGHDAGTMQNGDASCIAVFLCVRFL